MIEKAKELYLRHREMISYLFFGALTTAVDFVSYYALTRFLSVGENLANILSQIIAIIFAFFTNKLYVFEDKKTDVRSLLSQFVSFASLRCVTLVLNSLLFTVMLDYLKINDIVTKVIISVIVIILNYIFSKLIVFKKKK